VSLRDIKRRSSASTKPRVAITFDDGYRDNYQFALSRLLDKGFTATFFLIAGFIEGDRAVRERLAGAWGVSPGDVAPLEWGDVRAMRAEGMEFGSHTWSHANLARLEDAAAAHELVHSRELIQERLGEKIASVAYPFGKPRRHFTDETISLAAGAGYEWGVMVLPRGVRASDHRLRIPRFALGEDSVARLSHKVSGSMDGQGVLRELAPAWLDRFVSPTPVATHERMEDVIP
jgi:peptidoglycan/xylan/chitin deacetylase (PgdA/CDA1 family)